jgi:O-antigen/teichoic acid export membrane protein
MHGWVIYKYSNLISSIHFINTLKLVIVWLDSLITRGEDSLELEKKIISGSTFVLTSRVINWISLVIFSITMARMLGRDVYGLISIAVGFIGLFAIIGDIGLNIAGIRYISMYYAKKQYQDIRTIVKTSFLIKFSLAMILAVFCFLGSEALAEFFQKDVAPLFKLVAVIIICNILASVFQTVMKGMYRMDLFALSNIFRDVSWIIISIGLVAYGFGVVGALWGFLISAIIWLIICSIIYAVPLQRDLPTEQTKKKEVSKSIRNKLIVFGMPIVIMDITVLLYNWTDTFVLAYFHPTWMVSCYNIAFGLVNIVMIIIASVGTTLFPIFSREHALKKDQSQKRIYEKVVKMLMIIVYPLLTFMLFLSPFIILIWGEQYLPALMPLLILVLWGFFRPVGNIGSSLLTAKGRPKLVMKITISMAGLNFVLNLLLIPTYNMIGAAIATTIAFIFGAVATYIILYRDHNIFLEQIDTLKCLFAAILSGACGLGIYLMTDMFLISSHEYIDLFLLFLKLLISFLIAVLVYLGILKLIRMFTEDEIKIFEKLAKEYRIIKPIIGILK